jgi:uncharacterized protein YjbI with pentapeptide repeats
MYRAYWMYRRLNLSLPRLLKVSGYILITIIIASIFSAIVIRGPLWFDGGTLAEIPNGSSRAQAITSDRSTLLQMFVIFGGFATVIFTIRSYFLNKSGQVADRYTKAASQLASEDAAERIGAIYALARLMRDSPADHRASIDLLAAFIRERCSKSQSTVDTDEEDLVVDDSYITGVNWTGTPPAIDVQTALNVLIRRPKKYERPWILLGGTNLSGAHFTNGWVDNLHFENSIMHGIDMVNSKAYQIVLARCDLRGANFSGSDLRNAHFQETDMRFTLLRWADLRNAGLEEADLRGAVFVKTILKGAELIDANLCGADLTSAIGLTSEQVAEAIIDNETKLPDYISKDALLRNRQLEEGEGDASS